MTQGFYEAQKCAGTKGSFGVFHLCVAAALGALFLTVATSSNALAETAYADDEFGVLLPAPGVEETYAYCSGCHSERIVAQQGLTRQDWSDLMEWMVEEQGMGEIEEPDLTIVLDYLEKHYNEDRPNLARLQSN